MLITYDWIVLIAISLVLLSFDARWIAFVVWVLYFGLGWWKQVWNFPTVIDWTSSHLLDLLMYGVVYFIFGTAWATFKWILLYKKAARLYEQRIAEHNALDPKPRFADWIQKYYTRISPPIPKAIDNKAKIVDWITFWWISIIYTVFSDWMLNITKSIYNLFANFYDNLAKAEFAKIKVPDANEGTKYRETYTVAKDITDEN